ncbi:response regulator [Spirochaetota bacterium]
MKAIIAEDDLISSYHLKEILESLGHTVCSCVSSGDDAITSAQKEIPDIVFMDICMADKNDGIKAAEMIKKAKPDIMIVFISAYPRSTYAELLANTQYEDYIDKPIVKNKVKEHIARLKIPPEVSY